MKEKKKSFILYRRRARTAQIRQPIMFFFILAFKRQKNTEMSSEALGVSLYRHTKSKCNQEA